MNRIRQYKLDEQLSVSKQATNKKKLFTLAYDALIDFACDSPDCIRFDSAFEIVKGKLDQSRYGLLIVTTSQGKFLGVIEAEKTIHNDFSDKTPNIVERFYTPASELCALDYRDVRCARALDVIQTQKNNDRNFVLVVDTVLEEIRGIFTTHHFQKIVSPDIMSFPPLSFSELFLDKVQTRHSLLAD